MIVVGGIYREECSNPPEKRLRRVTRGSGLRAAAILRSVDPGIRLASALDEVTRDEADVILGGLGLSTEAVPRSEPVSFSYFTPLSPPVIRGRLSQMESLSAEADAALVFGMMEGEPRVSAKRLTYDPQQPLDLTELDLDRLGHDRLAIVANAAETFALGRRASTLEEAAAELRTRLGAEVVITKRAARGALVTTASAQEMVAPYPTASVWPIGSGDAFAAGFAWAWGEADATPLEAARVGSRTAAYWCETASLDVPASVLDGSAEMRSIEPREAQVYLAAPFFNLGQRWLVDLCRGSLRSLGGKVFSPMHDVGDGGNEVAAADLAGLAESQAVLALLDEDDPGTLFEAGWATARDLPVVAYAERPDAEGRKMLAGTGAEIHGDVATAVYRALWASMGWPLGT